MINIFRILIALSIFITALSQPTETLAAAQGALGSWWRNVVPALLPFFILTEFLSRTGLIQALSIWLGPVMQPLFRLPGAAALGICLGFFAGSPTGGAIAGQLRQQGLLSRNEGERLLAFCNNAGPLYIMLTVTAALGQPEIGVWLALAHYPLNLLWGLLLRFWAGKNATETNASYTTARQLLAAGWQAALGRNRPNQPLSLLLKESSLKALTNIGMIGAFMLIFSLLLLSLSHFGVLKLLQLALLPLCRLLNLPSSVLPALADGCFEMTLGIDALAACSAPLSAKLLTASIILAWSGLSIHCQIAGVLADSDLSLRYYLPCRLLHVLAAPALLLFCQNHGWLSLNSGWFAQTGPAVPDWLLLPGALLLPGLFSLGFLLAISFSLAGRRTQG